MNDEHQTAKHVLVVEDEPDFANLIASVLGKQGYEVAVAFNTKEAWERVRERAPDLVTLDLQMPRQSGLHFYREMKSQEALRHVPVVVITGIVRDDPDMENLVRSFLEVDHLPSPEAYIEKPFDNQELVDIVEHALGPA